MNHIAAMHIARSVIDERHRQADERRARPKRPSAIAWSLRLPRWPRRRPASAKPAPSGA